jgi:hypothetical protein
LTARGQRTQDCGRREARKRLSDARHQLVTGQREAANTLDAAARTTAGGLFVKSAIAAADAACCEALGRRSRSDNHRDAAKLLAQITPNGKEAATAFGRLIAHKDHVDYGLTAVSTADLKRLQRNAEKLLEFAESVVLP